MHWIGPRCQNPVEVVDASAAAKVLCPSCGSSFHLERAATTVSMEPEAQRTLGKFLLLETVGVGAFGTVFKARDSVLDRVVAGNLATASERDRFLRAARSVAQLRHLGIMAIHEVGQKGELPYLVSEYVPGVTLADRLTARRPPPREAAQLVAAAADALQYAHDQGIIHRDVKPSNIMLADDGGLQLMDFGLAKREADEITATIDGQVLGTLAYMTPAQARGESHTVDGRSDVYSLGVILCEMGARRRGPVGTALACCPKKTDGGHGRGHPLMRRSRPLPGPRKDAHRANSVPFSPPDAAIE